jgi:general secretion pathway protein D
MHNHKPWSTSHRALAAAFTISFGLLPLVGCSTPEDGGGQGPVGDPTQLVRGSGRQEATGLPAPLGTPGVAAKQSPLKSPEVYKGKGPAAGAASGTGEAPFAIGDGGSVTLNFVNADIREVIDTVLGDILGVTYIVDPRVAGTVTIRSARPIPQDKLVPTLENVLALNGAAVMESAGTYKVVPIETAATSVPPTAGGTDGPQGFGIHVIPLRFTSAASLREVLEPFVPPGRVLRVDTARNLLVFSGTGAEAAEFQDLVDVFDVDWMAGRSFGLFPVQYANPKTVAGELGAVFGPVPGGPAGGAVRFVPIERLRAVLAIAEDPALVEQAKTWIERLDRGQEGGERRVYVYRVQNGRAADLGRVLGQIFPATVSAVGRDGPRATLAPGLAPAEIGQGGFSPTAYDPAAGGPSPDLAQSMEGQAGGSFVGDAASAGVVGLGSGDINDDTGIGTPLSFTGVSADAPQPGGIRIVPDVRNNALVIAATPDEYRMIESAIRQLDVTPLQVLIEATIAEVTLNDELRYGLQWFFEVGNSSFTFSGLDDGTVNPIFPGFNYLFSSNNARVVLNALTAITDVKVISSPQLMVLNNETARLQVGDQVPIATQSAVSVIDPESPIVNSIAYRDTGVILSVSPRVNSGGLVVLDIIQEVSEVTSTTTSTLDSPTIQQRRVKSTVAVQSGETVALGGLIRDGSSKGVTGIPILSEIPILGNLFKTTTDTTRRTELLILLTPRAVTSRQDARDVTDELRERVRSLAPLEQRIQ